MAYNTVTVTGTATLIVDANPQRLSLIISNNGAETVYIGQDSSVTTTNGTPIPIGGNLTEDSGGARMYQGPIWGICTTTCNVRYWERVR